MNFSMAAPKATLGDLLKAWRYSGKFDMRRLSPTDRKRALEFGIIEKTAKGKYSFKSNFTPVYDLPIDVLFEALRSALVLHSGYSINNSLVWADLNVYPANNHLASDRDRSEREWALYRLDRDGYINWQAAGSVWRIDVLK